MSVERIQLLHEDYIRLTERFKALWTFHQFLRGVQKTFFASEPSYALDFGRLYDDVRAVAGTIDTTSPEKVAPRLRELSERLDAFARKLREADRHISPSYVRRFFEKVQPQDEKIAFHLLRFYFSQHDVDEDGHPGRVEQEAERPQDICTRPLKIRGEQRECGEGEQGAGPPPAPPLQGDERSRDEGP